MADARPGQQPAADLVRRATDRRLLEELLGGPALTRAELAAGTGISKPTVSESVRRLAEAGLLAQTGRQSGKRGPAGLLYRLDPGHGVALAAAAGPGGVEVRAYGPDGAVRRQARLPVPAASDGAGLGEVFVAAVREARGALPVLGAAVSVAGPVDVATGTPRAMAYAPFPLAGFDPRALLAAEAGVDAEVDNDVNWMAVAEQHADGAGPGSFLLCYLGEGIGGAVVVGGGLVRGARGLAGELAHVRSTGPDGRSRSLLGCLADLGLLRAGTEEVDVPAVRALLAGDPAVDRDRADALAAAVAGALVSAAALLDPEAVLLGGPWGGAPGFGARVAALVAAAGSAPPVRTTAADPGTALRGAGVRAVQLARDALLAGI